MQPGAASFDIVTDPFELGELQNRFMSETEEYTLDDAQSWLGTSLLPNRMAARPEIFALRTEEMLRASPSLPQFVRNMWADVLDDATRTERDEHGAVTAVDAVDLRVVVGMQIDWLDAYDWAQSNMSSETRQREPEHRRSPPTVHYWRRVLRFGAAHPTSLKLAEAARAAAAATPFIPHVFITLGLALPLRTRIGDFYSRDNFFVSKTAPDASKCVSWRTVLIFALLYGTPEQVRELVVTTTDEGDLLYIREHLASDSAALLLTPTSADVMAVVVANMSSTNMVSTRIEKGVSCMVELLRMLENALPARRFIVVHGIEELLTTLVNEAATADMNFNLARANVMEEFWRRFVFFPVLTPGASRALVEHVSPAHTDFLIKIMHITCTLEAFGVAQPRRRFPSTRVFLNTTPRYDTSLHGKWHGHCIYMTMLMFGTSFPNIEPPFPRFSGEETAIAKAEKARGWLEGYNASVSHRAIIPLPVRWALARLEQSSEFVAGFCSVYIALRETYGTNMALGRVMSNVLRAFATALDSPGARAMSPDEKKRLQQPVLANIHAAMLFNLVSKINPYYSRQNVVDDTRTVDYVQFHTALDACVAMPAWSTLPTDPSFLNNWQMDRQILWEMLLVSATGIRVDLFMKALKEVSAKCVAVRQWLHEFVPKVSVTSAVQLRQVADACAAWAEAVYGEPRFFAQCIANVLAVAPFQTRINNLLRRDVVMIVASLYWTEHARLRKQAIDAGAKQRGVTLVASAAEKEEEDRLRASYRPHLAEALGFDEAPAWLLPSVSVLPFEETHLVIFCYRLVSNSDEDEEETLSVPLIVPRSIKWPALLALRDSVPLMAKVTAPAR